MKYNVTHVLFVMLLLAANFNMQAQTTRYVKANGTGNGSSWSTASGELQAMINESAAGDEVWVAKGTYIPATDLFDDPNPADPREKTFRMKGGVAIYGGFAGLNTEIQLSQRNWITNPTTLSGEIGTVDDNDNCYRLLYNINNLLDNTAVLDGFTVTGVNGVNHNGVGIYNFSSSPTISNCIFRDNAGDSYGGSAANYSCSPIFTNCSFVGNSAIYGGGMQNVQSSPTLINCVFAGNTAANFGGGISNQSSSPILINCTFSGNTAHIGGDGIYSYLQSSPHLTGCIMWGNGSEDIAFSIGSTTVDYSIVRGGFTGTGNLDEDPLFVNEVTGDLHLQPGSPAINTGNDAANSTATDLDNNNRKVGTIDMGAYEYQGPPCTVPAIGTEPQLTQSICQNSTPQTLKVVADGSTAYQWYSNTSNSNSGGTIISGANTDSYVPPATTTGNLYYYVVVSYGCGSDTSTVAAITVNAAPNRLYVNANATGTNTGLSWQDAFKDLQSALNYSCSANLAEIWVARGIYKPTSGNDRGASFIMKNGVAIYGGFAGTENNLSGRNWKLNVTTLSGDLNGDDGAAFSNNGDNSYHVVYNSNNGLNNTAILDGFTITGGNNILSYPNYGGGVHNSSSSPAFINCTFYGNKAVGGGGGMYNYSNAPKVTNCVFTGNKADGQGGAMYNFTGGSPNVTNCSFSGNTATLGGGIYNLYYSFPALTNCILWGDTGGEIYDDFVAHSAAYNSIVQGGCPDFANCPGILNQDPLFVSATDLHLQSNSPAINTGTNTGAPTTDIDGTNRPLTIANPADMGAYEFVPPQGPTSSVLSVNGPAEICKGTGANLVVTITGGTSPYTVIYQDDQGNQFTVPNYISGTNIPVSPAVSTIYSLVSVSDAAANAGAGNSGTATIMVKPVPDAVATPPSQTICSGSPISTIALTGSVSGTVYNWTSDMPAIITGIATSGAGDISGSLTNSTTTPVTINYIITPVANGCDGPAISATIRVNPLPSATISGTTTICQNTGQPTISFTGSGGTAPYTFTYSLFDGTTTTTASTAGTVAAPTSIPGIFTYTLLSVQDAGSPACAQNIADQSAVATVNPTPDAGIIADNMVTAVSTGNVASVPEAGTGTTYTWGITNGTITGGLGTRSITYKAGASGTVSLTVAVTSGSNCGPVNGTKQVTITALPCPNVAVTVASAVCTLSTGNIASVADAGTGAKYVWTITGGTITAGAGTRSITYKAGWASIYPDCLKISVKVTNASGVCTNTSGTYKVLVSALPNAAIVASAAICKSSTGNTALVFNCGTGSTYAWSVTNGTITAGAGSNKITYTAGPSGSVTLSVTVTNPTGCKAYGSKVVSIATYPTASVTALSSICAGSTGNAASVASAGSGAKYAWTISNGVITTGTGTNSITYTAGTSGSVTLAVKVTNSGGCSVSSGNKIVTIIVGLNAAITTTSAVCGGSTNTASVASGAAGYLWNITNGFIPGSKTSSSIGYIAGTSGTVKLSVTVTNNAGCKSPGSKSVTITAATNAGITAASPVCSGSTANTASVVSAGSGAAYTWTISSGSTITSGSGTASIKYTAAASGSVTLNAKLRNSTGCTLSGSKIITVSSKVIPLFAAIGAICKNAKAPSLPLTSTNGIKGTWSPSVISTLSTGTKTYTFTPASGQCALAAAITITVKVCNSAARLVTDVQTPLPVTTLEAWVTPNPSVAEFTLTLKGSSSEAVEIRVMDIAGRPLHYAKGSANQSYKFGQRFASGIYIVEILQGKTVKTMKVVKGN